MNSLYFNKFNFANKIEQFERANYLSSVILLIFIVGLGYWGVIQPNTEQVERARQQEKKLKHQFEKQQQRVAQIPAYLKQLRQLHFRVGKMLKQFPSQNEMPSLLEEVSNLGIMSGLTIELFEPLKQQSLDFYRELSINLVVVGDYQQLAFFWSRIAQMNYFVTLHDFEIMPQAMDRLSSLPLLKKDSSNMPQKVQLKMKMKIKVYWAEEGGEQPKQKGLSVGAAIS